MPPRIAESTHRSIAPLPRGGRIRLIEEPEPPRAAQSAYERVNAPEKQLTYAIAADHGLEQLAEIVAGAYQRPLATDIGKAPE